MPADAVLFSEMTPQPDWEDTFNTWYDTEHIPIRMKVPGFEGAQRYRDIAGGGYLAVYDMAAPEVLESAEYLQIKNSPSEQTASMLGSVSGFTRYTGKLIGLQMRPQVEDVDMLLSSPFLYAVFFSVPADSEADFNAWYDAEHVPMLLGCAEWLGCRRYRIVSGAPENFTHIALHHLKDLSALDSPERARARRTEWRDRLASNDWFKGSYGTFARHGERFIGDAPQLS
ncbi:hypothetical protein GOZ80_18400 [Agrobacterium vitis]|uniref:Uncharacterized protein n=1 Tax=Agrobacterium vitis TaxID=373 RepID=A0AAE2UR53_AGRVI|nr:DUF4286 family protein [Agrobacterium vitis]MBF2714093.1 hypothetical protein [Agrobacterium vitis]MUO82406.1 hypothetical protein [Agrobacterium vitis]MUO95881.1 hypothetical protein [Agrobacterium vitis]MVA93960.1 hypothetical protein [Agrobacterium vitis]MVB03533.1 hypothetical protein [Agrobacterium vitis]